MNTFGLHPTDLPVPCQTFQCYGRAAYFLGRIDAPQGTTQLVCEQCASELKAQIIINALPKAEPIPPTDDPMTGIEDLKVAELKDLAETKGLKVPSKATKAEIITLLEGKNDE